MGCLLHTVLCALVLQVLFLGAVDSSHMRGMTFSWKATDDSSEIDIEWGFWFRRSYFTNTCDESKIANGTLFDAGADFECVQCSSAHRKIADAMYQCTDYSAVEDWQGGVGSTRFAIEPGIEAFDIGYSDCCWINLGNGGETNYQAQAHVNLSLYDGKINSSPVTSFLPVFRVQQGCQETLNIPVSDPDGDDVRCRWPLSTAEAGGVTQMPGLILDESDCVLTINASSLSGWYGVALVVEDFASLTSMVPKSKVPLQFLVYVYDSHSVTCGDKPMLTAPTPAQGQQYYLAAGIEFTAAIYARARAAFAPIVEFETTSPVGMVTSPVALVPGRTNEYFMNATWTPTTSQLGPHTMCFSALDSDGLTSDVRCIHLSVGAPPTVIQSWPAPDSGSFISNGRWILKFDQNVTLAETRVTILTTNVHHWQRTYSADVTQTAEDTIEIFPSGSLVYAQYIIFPEGIVTSSGLFPIPSAAYRLRVFPDADPETSTQPAQQPSMECSDSAMTVFIPQSLIGLTMASHLHFLDPACVGSPHNGTHIKIVTTYNRCGTFMEVHGENAIFFNVIHDEAVPITPGSVITRNRDIEIPVQCIMDMEGMARISFHPDVSKITFREDGYGSFNFSLRLYHDVNYMTPYLPADYPVHAKFGDKLYFEARTWSEPGLELFVQTCRAAPTSNPDDFHQYTFIRDGCTEDNSLQFHPSDDPDVEHFEIDVFAFIDTLPQPVVYVHCDMILCNSSDAHSKCAIGCPSRNTSSPLSVHRRSARSASGSHAYAITQGPISLMEDEGEEASSGMSSVQMPVLLATVGLLVGCLLVLSAMVAVMYKRYGHLNKYRPVSMDEN